MSSENEEYSQEITKQLILRTKRDVEAVGAQYGVVVMDSKNEIRDKDFSKLRMVVDWCNEYQTLVLDLSRAVTLANYFEVDRHFNKSGTMS